MRGEHISACNGDISDCYFCGATDVVTANDYPLGPWGYVCIDNTHHESTCYACGMSEERGHYLWESNSCLVCVYCGHKNEQLASPVLQLSSTELMVGETLTVIMPL